MLPESVLNRAASEMLDYAGSGQSVMEMSHRSKVYEEIIFTAQKLLREVMGIPDNYKVLFVQGGASLQFAAIPLNLMVNGKADYAVTGQFSAKAFKEGQKYGDCKCVATSKEQNFTLIPAMNPAHFTADADYFHICHNNTIYGSKFAELPQTGDVPLVADISSSILSEPIDVSKFGVLYGGAQKNVAPAGLTIVIVREDLLGRARKDTPEVMNWQNVADNDSMLNTPPCWSIYMCKLVLEWIQQLGGLEAMKERNEFKANVLYDYLDKSTMFSSPVMPKYRSLMNATFVAGNEELNNAFVKEAAANGFVNLKGHRAVGGMRASIYNAMPVEGVEALVQFMAEFERKYS